MQTTTTVHAQIKRIEVNSLLALQQLVHPVD